MDNYLERFSQIQVDKTKPVMLEVQVNGARLPFMNPHVPMTYEEITREVICCIDAGATIIHAHNTNMFLQGAEAYADYMRSWRPILEKYPDILWYSTVVAGVDPSQTGAEHIELLIEQAGMRIGCIDPGYVNLGVAGNENGGVTGYTYGWSLDQISRQVKMFKDKGCGIVFGIYEPGYLRTAHYFIRNNMAPQGSQIDLYLLGDYGLLATEPLGTAGLPPTVESLYYYLHLIEQYSLTGMPWFVSIWGAGSMDLQPLMRRVVELGGHLKVGLESHFDPQYKPTNLQLLAEAKELVREVGRPLATRGETAQILGV